MELGAADEASPAHSRQTYNASVPTAAPMHQPYQTATPVSPARRRILRPSPYRNVHRSARRARSTRQPSVDAIEQRDRGGDDHCTRCRSIGADLTRKSGQHCDQRAANDRHKVGRTDAPGWMIGRQREQQQRRSRAEHQQHLGQIGRPRGAVGSPSTPSETVANATAKMPISALCNRSRCSGRVIAIVNVKIQQVL